jgi:hypothetical protein
VLFLSCIFIRLIGLDVNYLSYFTLFKKIINHTNEFFNNNTLNWSSPYLSNYYFDKWLKSNVSKSNNQLKEFVDPFKEHIEI